MANPSSEVMRIAESYFQGLLRAPDGLGPVGELAGMWAPRAGTLGLTRAERMVDALLIYTGEVGNGGHHQFFWNRGRAGALEARVALREMKLDDLADILDDAIRLFPGGMVPADRDAVDAFYATCAERGQHARLDALDQAVYAIDDAARLGMEHWYEVWADEGHAVPCLLLLRPTGAGYEVLDPGRGNVLVFQSSDYDECRDWLLEDELVLVGRKQEDDPDP